MGYLGRRIGLSQDNGDSNPGAAGGAVGGGILDLFAHGYFERQGDLYNAPGVVASGMVATGGIISDYPDGGSNIYRAHIFTSSGTFDVTAGGSFGDTVEYLVVAGGGGGGYDAGGGGGAGAFRTNLSGHPLAQSALPVSVQPYTVTIGAGGGGSGPATPNRGGSGVDSVFGSITSPGGGGGGGVSPPSHRTGSNGGSGGGGAMSFNGGKGAYPGSPNPSPFRMGYDGGNGTDNGGDNIASGGGGGAGGAGSNATAPAGPGGAGGAGSPIAIETATAKLYAGGGGGGAKNGPGPGGPGGGGNGGHRPSTAGTNGTYSTGGGGGGGAVSPPAGIGGNGGSGIVVVRYKIAELTATAKATGGAISFYSDKTIHAFTNSGTFATTSNWSSATVDYLVVGGGGAGGSGGGGQFGGGGGGAGAVRIGTTPIGAHPVSTTIQVGGGGSGTKEARGLTGTPSYFGTPITAPGGGGGGGKDPEHVGGPGGSGGGSKFNDSTVNGGPGTGADYPGSAPDASPTAGWGNAGGPATGGGAGGGGGASSTGSSPPSGYTGGPGGTGIQIPSTFYDPTKSTIGFPGASGTGWIAGGGGGSTYGNPNSGGGGGGGATAGVPALGYAGAGWGQKNYSPGDPVQPLEHGNAKANSGSGGGGNNNGRTSFDGGSGLVLIAYPT